VSHRVLITGSSGFIGSHLFERFRDMGWSVLGIGRRTLPVEGYFVHDLSRPLPSSFDLAFDVVVHAAARSSPWGRRQEFERDNVQVTAHLIEYCIRHGQPRLVFISSSSVYYRPAHQFDITEETAFPSRAVNDYAATKRKAEALVQRYPGAWAILRPRAVIGPGDTVLFPRILRAAQAGRFPLLYCPDGHVVGDLIYIDNLVDCVVAAAIAADIHGCFNLTNNEPVPLIDFLLDVFRPLGIPAPARRVSVRTAMFMAGLLEWFHAVCLPDREPAITRFGVHVFAYSKTFNIAKMLMTLGPPRVPLAEGVGRIVPWVRRGGLSLAPT
jgi:nucleoside-diphosphate-sugar epimerase